ncbi:MAG: NAD(P)/FAD-dependent oxidoreductase [Anaerolineae bacterium]|nr:NAD(P)/FAD-dependent oxidoreductase [Anaerolineae bacterium]
MARPCVVIVGAGFGGLQAAKALANKPVDVLLIDRNNYHTFLPLLYQVATAGLEPEEIAAPVRGIVRNARNINFLLGDVTHIDADQQTVTIQADGLTLQQRYDFLVLSPGSVTSYFGLTDVESRAYGLKTLTEAIHLRNHVLMMFERASTEPDPAIRAAMMTFVVVGGGPTGLEISGALIELFHQVLRKDYPNLDIQNARVILIEATDRLLAPFPVPLQKSAKRQLEQIGVEVLLKKAVAQATDESVVLKSGEVIPTHTIIWAAGVQSAEFAGLKVEQPRARRIRVLPTLQVPDHQNIYIIGDAAYLPDKQGNPYPQLAPVAMQMGRLAGRNILATVEGKYLTGFRYYDRGIMATIGKSAAVAWAFNKVQLSGFLAWIAWLVLHLMYLVGFRNRANVLINWAWNWWTWERGVRIIVSR